MRLGASWAGTRNSSSTPSRNNNNVTPGTGPRSKMTRVVGTPAPLIGNVVGAPASPRLAIRHLRRLHVEYDHMTDHRREESRESKHHNFKKSKLHIHTAATRTMVLDFPLRRCSGEDSGHAKTPGCVSRNCAPLRRVPESPLLTMPRVSPTRRWTSVSVDVQQTHRTFSRQA